MDIQGKTIAILGGKTGLLGQSLTKAFKNAGAKVVALSSADCDILEPLTIQNMLERYDPDLLINTAAYTQVDLAEDNEEMAFALNGTAPPLLAAEAAKRSIPFVHYSTDFVFNGNKRTPYTVYDETNPFSVYGVSKAGGETNLLKLGYDRTLIIRISWLFGPGKINFVEKILSLCEERDTLTVVNDQTGSPSYAPDVAANSIKLIEQDATGIYHLCNSGETTWHGLASAAATLAGSNCKVEPVPSSAFPTKAVRPIYSVLDISKFITTTGETPRHWRDALKEYVTEELKAG